MNKKEILMQLKSVCEYVITEGSNVNWNNVLESLKEIYPHVDEEYPAMAELIAWLITSIGIVKSYPSEQGYTRISNAIKKLRAQISNAEQILRFYTK